MKKHYLTLSAIRGILFFVMILLSYILQFIILPVTSLPFPLLMLIPVTVSISLFGHETAGLFWGLISGLLWDMASPVTDGLYALIFPVIFLFTGLLSHYVLRNTCLTAAVFTAVFSLIPSLLGLIYSDEAASWDFISGVIKSEMLPAVISSVIVLIPLYFLTGKINRRFTSERF